MNKIDLGLELAEQKRKVQNYRNAGGIWPDGSIQGAQPDIRYKSGVIAINESDLALAESHGWTLAAVDYKTMPGTVAVTREMDDAGFCTLDGEADCSCSASRVYRAMISAAQGDG